MIRRMFTLFLALMIVISLFTACGTVNESIRIDNDFAKNILVEKNVNNLSDQDSSKKISDVSKVMAALSIVDGLKVKEADENASEILKANQTKEPYTFSFFKEKMETGKEVPYSFIALEDGTFIFTHDKVDSVRKKPLVTVEKHKDLLEKLKEELEIKF